jgi:DNA polymerase I
MSRKVVIDIECNSLVNPTHIWVIVCREILVGGQTHIFRGVTENEQEKERFLAFASGVDYWIGHNLLGYDYPILDRLLGLRVHDMWAQSCDTLIASKLFDYSRKGGHSIEQYGKEFGLEKVGHTDWTKYSKEMEERCVRDVDICERIYNRYCNNLLDSRVLDALKLEQRFQGVVNNLHDNGFSFDSERATNLLSKIVNQLGELDNEIKKVFLPKSKLIREVHPKLTKHGTLNRADFRWVRDGDLSDYNGGPFSRILWAPFNPSSHKQLVAVLNEAGWKPYDKTASGLSWKVNENNLNTLPKTAPSPARTLARRILLESRRRTLTEWLGLVREDKRIHGKFYGIGAWTHRMAHQEPNTANIPTLEKLYGREMRSLWRAPGASAPERVLVGVDAEGIQLRIFAHYIDDKEFTDALVRGKKTDKTDPHSLNQRILGSACASRQIAKRFIYALLLGAGLQKLAQILETSLPETEKALDRLLERYTGFARLKAQTIPKDAKNGFFIGLDGRRVPIPGQTPSERRHLAMSGYLQNGESVIMKKACCMWAEKYKLVNFVHDEWVVECDEHDARRIGRDLCNSIAAVGVDLKLRCPLAGEYHVGRTWADIH